jgi:zinc protease
MSEALTRLALPNGLLVLLKEIHTAPLISHWLWYRVGSRDEVPGLTGASHWVEHMQFRGTPKYPAGMLDRLISRQGGFWNASTFLDWTVYLATMPSDSIDLILDLEADRMAASRFDLPDVEAERTVIISERQGSENEPLFLLSEAVQTAAFQSHPYRHEVIGSLADLQSMQRDDLYAHYRTYYQPNNAVLSIAGDFDTASMTARLQELYEPIPAGMAPPRPARLEPPLQEEQQLVVEGPGETVFVEMAYRCPAAGHPDFWPMTVLDSLLSGASSPSLFGGGISNKTSRLYRALVDQELAVSVGGDLLATLDPFLYSLTLVLPPDSQPQPAIAAVETEIRRLQDSPPTQEELRRAVKQARALFAYSSESISHQASWLGFAEIVSGADWFTGYLDRLAEVTPQEVQRAAQQYLRPERRVLGIYLPTGEPLDDSALEADSELEE